MRTRVSLDTARTAIAAARTRARRVSLLSPIQSLCHLWNAPLRAPLHALSYKSPHTPTTLPPSTPRARHTGDNGRYSQIFGQLMNARSSINLAQSHLQCQLPYGYVHLILLIIHATCFANSIFSGIQLGHTLQARAIRRAYDVCICDVYARRRCDDRSGIARSVLGACNVARHTQSRSHVSHHII